MEHQIAQIVPSNFDTIPYPQEQAAMLPKLPIPSLHDTLNKYLDAVKPLLTEQKFQNTSKLVRQFANGIGPQAQEYLYERREEKENWANEYFINEYYMDWRTPLTTMLTTATVLPPREFKNAREMARYGAAMIYACVTHKILVDQKKIPVAKAKGASAYPLCMGQWYNILTSCRVPDFKRDRIVSTLGTGTGQEHVVIIHKKQFYSLVVKKKADNGRPIVLSLPELTQALVTILKEPSLPSPSVGVLSTWDRDNWAEAYQFLIEEPRNKKNIELLQSCLLVLCFDDPLPAENFNRTSLSSEDYVDASQQDVNNNQGFRAGQRDETNMFHQILHGGGSTYNGANRWYEKSIQVVISSDGVSGILMEHTLSDGICLEDLIVKILDYVEKHTPEDEKDRDIQVPKDDLQKMSWIIGDEIESYIGKAALALDKIVADIDLFIYRYPEFGNACIKSLNCSPDSFVQLAIQLAYFKHHKHMETTWESVSTRRFRLGRVEVGRVGSKATLKWLEAMEAHETDEKCLEKLKVALDTQAIQVKDCSKGRGFDLHLLGLREASRALTNSLPAMFQDDSYKVAHKFTLGTSQVPTRTEMFTGYGHPVHDGYGCCYNIRDEFIIFSISSWKSNASTSSSTFARGLQMALSEMKRLLLTQQTTVRIVLKKK